MAITKRAGRRAAGGSKQPPPKKGESSGVKKATYFDNTHKKEVGVSDLTLLSKITEEAINENLKKRFENGIIYTYIGHVLISVNPFKDLGIYTEETLQSYKGKNRLEMPPHVFAIAEAAFYNMKSYYENQCVIISGESGAGKTEAAKRLMQYIASVSSSSSSSIQRTKDMVLATNPLLESFGCAKTLRNNNSSRHGKYLEILFNRQAEPVGANITNYLLEKNRVVGQIRNERNFHIFYQFTKAANKKYREQYGIQPPESYVYTSASGCTSVEGIDDIKDFNDTIKAMETIGVGVPEQDEIFRMLSIILWLGNITFVEDESGNAQVADTSVTNFVAYLMGVDESLLQKAVTIRIMETSRGMRRGSIYEVPLNIVQATAVRDALSKAIYFNLFDWIVARVNKSLNTQNSAEMSIGILDIYGFEIFENNSFEQLCINYVNEKLQQIFIQLTLKAEQDEYVREKIQWNPIKYFNNKIVCDLIEAKRPPGVFAALNDSIATAHADSDAADQSFMQRMSMLSANPHFESRQNSFIIKHYAGDVQYQVSGITDKNKDVLLKDLLDLLHSSSNPFLKALFPGEVDHSSKRRPPTAGDKIKSSANDLVETLMKCTPSYIRTIKPNQTKSPNDYDSKMVLHQIKYLGLQENVRIRRAGFAYRQTYEKFVERFYLLSGKTSYAGDYIWTGDSLSATKQILHDAGIPKEEYQLGVSKVFIKTPETLFALEHMRDRYWHNMATRIQRAWRAYLRKRVEAAIIIQRAWRGVCGVSNSDKRYIELRDYGTKLLGRQKERRRMSMLGSRMFLGDYLGLDGDGGVGGYLRQASHVPTNERVEFSCRGEILISKFGRSSNRYPRIFVVTNRAFYIIVQSIVNNQMQITLERTIPVGNIRSVSLSNLCDDWVAVGCANGREPDLFINCVFKTELVTKLKLLNKNIDIKIGPVIHYERKPGKMHQVKFLRDPSVPRDDIYKSGTVRVPPGLSESSISAPMPRRKIGGGKKSGVSTKSASRPPNRVQNVSRPAQQASARAPPAPMSSPRTNSRRAPPAPSAPPHRVQQQQHHTRTDSMEYKYRSMILDDNVPSNRQSGATAAANSAMNHYASVPGSAKQQMPQLPRATHNSQQRKPVPSPSAPAATTRRVPGAPAGPTAPTHRPTHRSTNSTASFSQPQQNQQSRTRNPTNPSSAGAYSSPPAPPAPPAKPPSKPKVPSEPAAKALYDFASRSENELGLTKDEVLIIVKKENNGWWLVKRGDGSNVSGWAPSSYLEEIAGGVPSTNGNTSNGTISSGTENGANSNALAGGLAEALKKKQAENSNLAGGLAEALRARQTQMNGDDDEDDDW